MSVGWRSFGRGAVGMLLLWGAGCDARLAGELTEAQANEVLVALHEHGIDARKRNEGGTTGGPRYTVHVASDEVAQALTMLQAQNLPRPPGRGVEETFGEGGLVPSPTEERARYLAALGGELSRTLARIDGVVDARVHVALPETTYLALDGPPPAPRASVLIKHRVDLPPPADEAIGALVAGAVQGMDASHVSVLRMVAMGPPPVGEPLTSLGPLTVTRGSLGLLKAILVGSLLLHVLLAFLLVGAVTRTRRRTRGGWATRPPAGEHRPSEAPHVV